jgi:adenine deaminase
MTVPEPIEALARRIRVARGLEPADVLFVNGKVVCTFTGEVLEMPVAVAEGRVVSLGGAVREAAEVVDLRGAYLAPAFTDPHIHVESSMLTPEGFAEAVVPHGTGATVSDPHEIVNVLGLQGLAYMRAAAEGLPVDLHFTMPSCVPATHMETAGADLDAGATARALDAYPDVPALSEMMNFPGVIFCVPDVLQKVQAARSRGFAVDGHSPGLTGSDAEAYLNAGILTDHECVTAEEARYKLRSGMWVLMRQGSAAKNLGDLAADVTPGNAHRLCIASDDRHPEDLVRKGHLDDALRVAVEAGIDPLLAVRFVTLNPATLYGFRDRGGIAPSYLADLVVLSDLRGFEVQRVYHRGVLVARDGELLQPIPRRDAAGTLSSVHLPGDLVGRLSRYPASGKVRVIGVEPAQLLTRNDSGDASEAGPGKPLQFAAVVERHRGTGNVGLGFVSGFGLAAGAFASTVSHDSHNCVLVGCSAEEMAHAARVVAEMGGGQAVVRGGEVLAALPLPVAGLMSSASAREVSDCLEALHVAARACGCKLPAPFMTLAFIALPVIPSLKITDRGLVDVDRFEIVPLSLSE